jgi:hypothetical protein
MAVIYLVATFLIFPALDILPAVVVLPSLLVIPLAIAGLKLRNHEKFAQLMIFFSLLGASLVSGLYATYLGARQNDIHGGMIWGTLMLGGLLTLAAYGALISRFSPKTDEAQQSQDKEQSPIST